MKIRTWNRRRAVIVTLFAVASTVFAAAVGAPIYLGLVGTALGVVSILVSRGRAR